MGGDSIKSPEVNMFENKVIANQICELLLTAESRAVEYVSQVIQGPWTTDKNFTKLLRDLDGCYRDIFKEFCTRRSGDVFIVQKIECGTRVVLDEKKYYSSQTICKLLKRFFKDNLNENIWVAKVGKDGQIQATITFQPYWHHNLGVARTTHPKMAKLYSELYDLYKEIFSYIEEA